MDMAEVQVFHISPCCENDHISLPPSCIAIMESGSAEVIQDAATIKLHTPQPTCLSVWDSYKWI